MTSVGLSPATSNVVIPGLVPGIHRSLAAEREAGGIPVVPATSAGMTSVGLSPATSNVVIPGLVPGIHRSLAAEREAGGIPVVASALLALVLALSGPGRPQPGQLQEPAGLRAASLQLQKCVHLARGGYDAVVLVGFVVLLDVFQLVAIVAHESVGLAQSFRRDIPLPIDPF